MAAPRRRTPRSAKKPSMRRGPQKPKKPPKAKTPRVRKTRSRGPIDWKGRLMKGAIGLFLLVDLALVFFFIRQCAQPPLDPLSNLEPQTVQRPLQIEVLNGCGVSGIANTFTEFLRAQGFDVVKTDNYIEGGAVRFSIATTVVVDRRGDEKQARRIARTLGLGADRVLSEPNDAYLIDATVILGADFASVPAWPSMEKQ